MHRRWTRAVLAGLILSATACGPGEAPPPSAAETESVPFAARTALYEVFVRDFSPSGDLAGVEAGLDRIQASGAEVVWLMPIHPVGEKNRKGEYGSPYAVRDYRAINPDFGTAEDLRSLVSAVHARGMKLIIDWVPNHTGWDNVWITEHPEYYARNEAGPATRRATSPTGRTWPSSTTRTRRSGGPWPTP
jgi:glycosidase